jgi:hypothetical protein
MWLCSSRPLLAVIVTVLSLSSTGCGYALAGRGNFLPAYIRTIGIPAFTNSTSFFDIAQLVTDKVRTEFIGRGNYKIVPESTGVDAVLAGSIVALSIVPTAFSPGQQASRYVITVTASIELRDAQKSTVLWTKPSDSVREEYVATAGSVSTDPAAFVDRSAFFNQETNAVERVSSEFARTIVSAILEAF